MGTVVFRELPGMEEVERRLLESDRLFKDEIEQLEKDLDCLSLTLFGITLQDTAAPPAPDDGRMTADYMALAEEWPTYFEWLDAEEIEAERVLWEVLGIDMTDEDGDYLACLSEFGRQITCVFRRLHPAASFRFLPDTPKTDEQIAAAAEAWGRSLLSK